MQKILGKGSKFNWSTVSCIVEDVMEPHNVVELATQAGGDSSAKDFKKNIRRAEREGVDIREHAWDQWSDEQKKEVEDGIVAWKKAKSGLQLASVGVFHRIRSSSLWLIAACLSDVVPALG